MSSSVWAIWAAQGSKEKNQFEFFFCSSDEFELKFPELSQAELKGFRAKSSRAGAFQFLSWNQNDKN